uniref:ZP domain-containing protein n=1 Tax=Heterorhabditis bacteriophora TaxID=37862 RepID=A0A1I7XDQ5_HETBA
MAILKLDLNAQHCGIRYDEELDLYSLTVDVHSHPILIVDDDKSVNITCKGKNNSTKSKDRDSKDFTLAVFDNGFPIQEVEYAKKYSLQIQSLSSQSSNIQVGICTTTGAGNMTVELTDERGCSILPSLLSDFSRTNSGIAADIHSMFRFPIIEQITFTCQVSICGRHCEENSCTDERTPVSRLLDRTTTVIDSDDVQYVSTTVTVFKRKEEGLLKPNFFDERRNSGASYASVKQKPRRTQLPNVDYGLPVSRSSDGSSEFRGDIYRRPEVRLSNSTFMTPSNTMETDLDSSPSSNQASSYH